MNRILTTLTLAGLAVLIVTNASDSARLIKALSAGMDNYINAIGRGQTNAAYG